MTFNNLNYPCLIIKRYFKKPDTLFFVFLNIINYKSFGGVAPHDNFDLQPELTSSCHTRSNYLVF